MKVCVPSFSPGGIEALSNMHFGHPECYTIVEIAHEKVKLGKMRIVKLKEEEIKTSK